MLFSPHDFFFCPSFSFSLVFLEMYLKFRIPNRIMARCLFCGVYCEVKCGVYCEGYPGNQGEKEKEEGMATLGCMQIGTSYICENCLKELKQALEIL
jgi:hypothetical protein